MPEDIEIIKKEHEESYRNSIIELIKNNTNVLVYDDIKSLLVTPPLDSMDTIKSKFLDIAKKNNMILNIEKLNHLLNKYRENLVKCCDDIYELRFNSLSNIVIDFKFSDKNNVIKINKKDFNIINKNIKNIIKKYFTDCFDKYISCNINSIFDDKIDDLLFDKFFDAISRFFKNNFQKQFFDSFDIKILVKDTILINATKENGDRYQFILNNSRVFDE